MFALISYVSGPIDQNTLKMIVPEILEDQMSKISSIVRLIQG